MSGTSLPEARWLITFGTLAYGLGPFFVDMNRTHLLHPKWTGHARFHLLWASLSQLAVAAMALGLMWARPSDPPGGCRLAGIIGLLMTSGFWGALLLKRLYGGTLHDTGGVPPLLNKVDGNLIAVILIDGLLIAGLVTLGFRGAAHGP